jgi:hypothetical protein
VHVDAVKHPKCQQGRLHQDVARNHLYVWVAMVQEPRCLQLAVDAFSSGYKPSTSQGTLLRHAVALLASVHADDATAATAAAAAARLENTLNYGMERIWAIGVMKGSNSVAFGFDEGVAVVKIGECNKILKRHHLLKTRSTS